jgi:hypothetical protein
MRRRSDSALEGNHLRGIPRRGNWESGDGEQGNLRSEQGCVSHQRFRLGSSASPSAGAESGTGLRRFLRRPSRSRRAANGQGVEERGTFRRATEHAGDRRITLRSSALRALARQHPAPDPTWPCADGFQAVRDLASGTVSREAWRGRLLYDLVSAGKDRLRHVQTEGLCGLEIKHQLEFGRLLNW